MFKSRWLIEENNAIMSVYVFMFVFLNVTFGKTQYLSSGFSKKIV